MSMVPYGISVLTLFIFLFVTPTGLLAVYLVTSGTVRAVAAYTDVDDARGRFRVSDAHWAWTTLWTSPALPLCPLALCSEGVPEGRPSWRI